ncbi:MAG: DoxX family membrane protein [Actinobacteria bacterium]|nr:DoxX family membrane protein [Actinomycetota bacterium]
MSGTKARGLSRLWWHPLTATVARVALAGVLGFAGAIKLIEDQGTRRRAILAYRLPGMSVDAADIVGLLLPAFEVALAVCLLLGLFVRLSGLATAVLMAVFIVGIVSVWVRGYSIDCGCFGGGGDIDPAGRHARYAQEVLRDLLFAGLGVRLWLSPRSWWAGQRV